MSRSARKTATLVVLIAVVVAAPFVWGLLFWGDYPTEQAVTRSFTLDEDFTTVRKILVHKDGAKQIITMGGDSEFVEQSWKEFQADTEKKQLGEALLDVLASPEPTWRLGLEGTLKVRTLDDYVGKQVVTLKQVVAIEPDFLDSKTDLVKGTERLVGYAMTTRFSRDQAESQPEKPSEPEEPSDSEKPSGALRQILNNVQASGATTVELSLTQKIITQAPWFAHRVADRRVRESVEKTLANQEQAIRLFIEVNKNDVPVFPLR